ncbi:hypothetical protein K488DRAFT_84365 [Vararia minispora EC-137]|uniref:Uncharacterized protein n=1 Tax=Vararia minispora EC-137 TaxID=1314806 RepID=A0ACB8QQ85_9AGAM|nr:hypothetical protein K488DRAFT_84365 [Vararia minispora EC-137]
MAVKHDPAPATPAIPAVPPIPPSALASRDARTAPAVGAPLTLIPSRPSTPLRLKSIIKHSASYAGRDTMLSRSSSTSTADDNATDVSSTQELHTVRSSSSLPTRPPSPCPNVKFAPLPSIEPRRRKSNVKLGVAARSRMIQARRNGGKMPPDWADADEAPVQRPPPPPGGEDPFEVFGRFVVGKTRSLWRKMSSPQLQPTPVVVGETVDETAVAADHKVADLGAIDVVAPHIKHRFVRADEASPPSTVSCPPTENEGGVWEDEVGEQYQLRMKRANSRSSTKEEKHSKRQSFSGKVALQSTKVQHD